MSDPYLFWDGLQHLSAELSGNESIHVGIRPFELHAGNVTSIVAYPLLLCEAVRERGKQPRFTFYVSVNDWEQDRVTGPDVFTHSLDVRPYHTTIGHQVHSTGIGMVDYWQPRIERELAILTEHHPEVRLIVARNSSLKSSEPMRTVIENTIKHPAEQKALMARVSRTPVTNFPAAYCNVICPHCRHANTNSVLNANRDIEFACDRCWQNGVTTYHDADFWLFHKQLWVARLAVWHFDVAVSGVDHFDEGDVGIRRVLYEYIFHEPMPDVRMLFAPLLVARDGNRMSKYRDNGEYASTVEVAESVRGVNTTTWRLGWP